MKNVVARPFALALILMGFILLFASCNQGEGQDQAVTTAAVASPSADNAGLAAEDAQSKSLATPGVHAVATSVPVEEQAPAMPESPIAAAAPESASRSALPGVIQRIPLAMEGQMLVDLVLDSRTDRIFVVDSAGQLHVLDDQSYAVIATLPIGDGDMPAASLLLDSERNRLFIASGDLPLGQTRLPAVALVNTETLALERTFDGFTHVDGDAAGNRIFLGHSVRYGIDESKPFVRLLDGETFDLLGEIPQVGVPVYNPRRDELVIVAYSAFAADPNSFQLTADLLPEISAQELKWCNGCDWVEGAQVFVADNLLALNVQPISAGKGAGYLPRPRLFDATTLDVVDDARTLAETQPECSSKPNLRQPIDGQIYVNERFDRYVVLNNLDIYSTAGEPITKRDGIRASFVNPNTKQAYLPDGRVLDLATLTPLGYLPRVCFMDYDVEQGILFGAQGSDLLVIDEAGDERLSLPGPVAADLPEERISAILLSPAFAEDNTVFIVVDDRRLYRSTDGGVNWIWLDGLVADDTSLTLDVALSPEFAQDRTLFAGGHRGESWGEGVMRSSDGGDSWQPMWNGLQHLRVHDVVISPDFGADETLLAYARYNQIVPWEEGYSVHLSTDGGQSWDVVQTVGNEADLPAPERLLPFAPVAEPILPVRIADFGRALERTTDGGVTWQPVELDQRDDEYVLQVLLAPGASGDGPIYVLGEYSLWRTDDGAATWGRLSDPRFEGRDFASSIEVGAISPPLPDGGYQIFVATNNGEFWSVAIDEGVGQPQGEPTAEPQTDSPLPTPTATQPPSPALLPTATSVLTAGPAPTATPVPTPSPTRASPLAGEPPAGLFRPGGSTSPFWEAGSNLQQLLGWATEQQPHEVQTALQPFEHGLMVWHADDDAIYLLYNDHTWAVYEDTFEEGETEFDPAIDAPSGLQQPVRGFGKVWREHEEVREQIGWALKREEPFTAATQRFENGAMIQFGISTYGLAETPEGDKVWR